eukprot:Rhum_TRINITY_DN20730_c0_g1::Rhum_TRINITY_DN20730_c0_g1_i1::g.171983::m.171983
MVDVHQILLRQEVHEVAHGDHHNLAARRLHRLARHRVVPHVRRQHLPEERAVRLVRRQRQVPLLEQPRHLLRRRQSHHPLRAALEHRVADAVQRRVVRAPQQQRGGLVQRGVGAHPAVEGCQQPAPLLGRHARRRRQPRHLVVEQRRDVRGRQRAQLQHAPAAQVALLLSAHHPGGRDQHGHLVALRVADAAVHVLHQRLHAALHRGGERCAEAGLHDACFAQHAQVLGEAAAVEAQRDPLRAVDADEGASLAFAAAHLVAQRGPRGTREARRHLVEGVGEPGHLWPTVCVAAEAGERLVETRGEVAAVVGHWVRVLCFCVLCLFCSQELQHWNNEVQIL